MVDGMQNLHMLLRSLCKLAHDLESKTKPLALKNSDNYTSHHVIDFSSFFKDNNDIIRRYWGSF